MALTPIKLGETGSFSNAEKVPSRVGCPLGQHAAYVHERLSHELKLQRAFDQIGKDGLQLHEQRQELVPRQSRQFVCVDNSHLGLHQF